MALLDKLIWKSGPSGTPAKGPQAPEMFDTLRYPDGPFQFKTDFSKQTFYEVQATTNLKNWTRISSGGGKGEIEVVDKAASQFSYRFYRLSANGIFSSNVVGYVTITLPPGFSMIANPLDSADSTVAALFPGMPEGSSLSIFNPQLHRLMENNVENGKWRQSTERLGPGEGAIFFNPTRDYRTVSFSGEVMSRGFSIPILAGFSVRSSPLPLPGQLDTDLGFPINPGDEVHLFDRERQAYVVHVYGTGGWETPAPVVGTGESFWIGKKTPRNWVRESPLGHEKDQQTR